MKIMSSSSLPTSNIKPTVASKMMARYSAMLRSVSAVLALFVAASFANAASGVFEKTENGTPKIQSIDIIAFEGEVLVFCEVKTRSATTFGDPAEAVSGAKAGRMRHLALRWLVEQRGRGRTRFWAELRFDVVSVVRQPRGAAEVVHLRAAF